jgi:hypothetical protein
LTRCARALAEDELIGRLMPSTPGSMSRMCLTVMRLSLATMVLPVLSLMSARDFAAQASGTTSNTPWLDVEAVEVEKFLRMRSEVGQRLQQDGDRHLAAAVDAGVSAGSNSSRARSRGTGSRENNACGRMRLAAVVLEGEHARERCSCETMTLSAVDDERAEVLVMSGIAQPPPAPSLPWWSAWARPCRG